MGDANRERFGAKKGLGSSMTPVAGELIGLTSLIPESLKERAADSLVDFLASNAERLGSDQAARKIRKLSSQAAYRESVNTALERGMQRFVDEYTQQDEDLVTAIMANTVFWQTEAFQAALIEMVQHPGALLPHKRETLNRHFEWVEPQQVNRQRVDKAVTYLLTCIAEELWSLPGAKEVREIYALQFQRMEAEDTRRLVALAQQQLEATYQFNAELRDAFLQLTGAMETKLLAAPAAAALPAPRPYNNLPQPTYTRFVGREQELEWLRQRLSPNDRAWQIAITGIGGVGKSALALAIGHEFREHYEELPEEERFEAIIWVSAKEEVLSAYGREQASLPENVLHTLEDVYTGIAHALEREDITRAEPDDQGRLVERALKRQRTLLIMDNLESVEDERVRTFLRHHLPYPTKALITSREWIDVAAELKLTGLAWDEASDLIEEEAASRAATLDEKQRKRVFELTAGLPLPIKLAVARIAGGESFLAVERWLGDATGDLPEYCVQGQVDLVRERDPNAWTVLLACSLFDREAGASREALGEIANLSLVDRDQALSHLQRLFLVNQTKHDRFWILPIVQRYIGIEFGEEGREGTVSRWIEWALLYAESHGPHVSESVDDLDKMEREYPNFQLAIQFLEEHESWLPLARLCANIQRYMYQVSLYTEQEAVLQTWHNAVRHIQDREQEGQVNLQFGRLMAIWNRDKLALAYLTTAEDLLEDTLLYSDLAEAWTTLSQLLSRQGKVEEARSLALDVLALGERAANAEIKLTAAHLLADIEGRDGHLDLAMDWMIRAEPWAINSRVPQKIAGIWDGQATILFRRGNMQEAERLFLASQEINAAFRTRRFLAYVKYYLAQVYAATGRLELARRTAEEACDLYDRIGMKVWQTKVEALLETLK